MLKKQIGNLTVSYNVDRYLSQVMEGNEYSFRDYYPVIIDIGSNIGTFALSMKDKARSIYCIEPSEENVACLNQTIEDNDIRNILVTQGAISDSSIVKKLFKNGDPGMGGWKLDDQGEDPIQCFTLSDYMKILGIKYVDLVKIDVEGHELTIFHDKTFPYSKIGAIIGEWHNHIEPIQERLEWLGYKFIDMGNNHFIARRK